MPQVRGMDPGSRLVVGESRPGDPEHVGQVADLRQERVGDRPGDVDGSHSCLTPTEDPVLHVLDIEAGLVEPVQDPGEHPHPVEVSNRQDRPSEAAAESD